MANGIETSEHNMRKSVNQVQERWLWKLLQ